MGTFENADWQWSQDDLPVNRLLREALDLAIQRVLGSIYPSAGLGRCATYAIVGAQVLSKVLKHDYRAVAGGQVMDCGRGLYVVFFPSREDRRRANALNELLEYHCWIESDRLTTSGQPRIEIVDFTLRHDETSATLFGVPFHRHGAPNYLWQWADVLARSFPTKLRGHPQMLEAEEAWHWRDEVCTRLLQKMHDDEPEFYATVVQAVINQLSEITQPVRVKLEQSGTDLTRAALLAEAQRRLVSESAANEALLGPRILIPGMAGQVAGVPPPDLL